MPDVQMSRFIIAKEGRLVLLLLGEEGREVKEVVERRRREGGVGGMGWDGRKLGGHRETRSSKRRESETHE